MLLSRLTLKFDIFNKTFIPQFFFGGIKTRGGDQSLRIGFKLKGVHRKVPVLVYIGRN